MAKKVKPLNRKQINEIKTLSAIGLTQKQIAQYLGIGLTTLKRRIEDQPVVKDAFREGESKAAAKIYNSAYEMAHEKKHPGFTQFYLRSRYKWSVKEELDISMVGEVDPKAEFLKKIQGMDSNALEKFIARRKENKSDSL